MQDPNKSHEQDLPEEERPAAENNLWTLFNELEEEERRRKRVVKYWGTGLFALSVLCWVLVLTGAELGVWLFGGFLIYNIALMALWWVALCWLAIYGVYRLVLFCWRKSRR